MVKTEGNTAPIVVGKRKENVKEPVYGKDQQIAIGKLLRAYSPKNKDVNRSVLENLPDVFFDVFTLKIKSRCKGLDIKDYLNDNHGTIGWNEDLKRVCKKCNCMWFYYYLDSMNWKDFDNSSAKISEIIISRLDE